MIHLQGHLIKGDVKIKLTPPETQSGSRLSTWRKLLTIRWPSYSILAWRAAGLSALCQRRWCGSTQNVSPCLDRSPKSIFWVKWIIPIGFIP